MALGFEEDDEQIEQGLPEILEEDELEQMALQQAEEQEDKKGEEKEGVADKEKGRASQASRHSKASKVEDVGEQEKVVIETGPDNTIGEEQHGEEQERKEEQGIEEEQERIEDQDRKEHQEEDEGQVEEVLEIKPDGTPRMSKRSTKDSTIADEEQHEEEKQPDGSPRMSKRSTKRSTVAEEEQREEEQVEEEWQEEAEQEEELMEIGPDVTPIMARRSTKRSTIAEEEEEGIDLDEISFFGHPPNTVSFLVWKLYTEWLEGFANNMQKFGSCLKNFPKDADDLENTQAFKETQTVLTHFREYITYCRAHDDKITEFFKDKPITKCPQCLAEYSIDNIPEFHVIPKDLVEAIKSTQKWKALLEDTEEHCRALSRGNSYIFASCQNRLNPEIIFESILI